MQAAQIAGVTTDVVMAGAGVYATTRPKPGPVTLIDIGGGPRTIYSGPAAQGAQPYRLNSGGYSVESVSYSSQTTGTTLPVGTPWSGPVRSDWRMTQSLVDSFRNSGRVAAGGIAASSSRAALVDPQLDANILAKMTQRDPTVVAYARANQEAGLSYNFATRAEYLAGGTRAELRVLEEQYGLRLIREIPPQQIDATAVRLRGAFADGRILGVGDSRVAATAYLTGERFATADLQFFKRALDLGLNAEFVGTGNAAAKAAAYSPRPVVVPLR